MVAETPSEYTIDELAAAARVPSRTIRFYQSRGALMAPEIRGRVAYYGPAHLERLGLIAQLQDRGLKMDAIRDLVLRIDRGEIDLAEWLGIERQAHAPWVDDRPRAVTEEELYELAGARRPGLVADLIKAKLARRHGDGFLVGSPALLVVGMKLTAAGVDLETGLGASAIVRKHASRAVKDLLDYFVDRVADGTVSGDPAAVLQALRAAGNDAVRVIFGREMERALRRLLESGKLSELHQKARKRKRGVSRGPA